MEVIYTKLAQEDREYWLKNNQKMVEKIDKLISDIQQRLYTGLGKPEPLRFAKSDYWSRRIDIEHRLIYKIADNVIYIAQCRHHYTR